MLGGVMTRRPVFNIIVIWSKCDRLFDNFVGYSALAMRPACLRVSASRSFSIGAIEGAFAARVYVPRDAGERGHRRKSIIGGMRRSR